MAQLVAVKRFRMEWVAAEDWCQLVYSSDLEMHSYVPFEVMFSHVLLCGCVILTETLVCSLG